MQSFLKEKTYCTLTHSFIWQEPAIENCFDSIFRDRKKFCTSFLKLNFLKTWLCNARTFQNILWGAFTPPKKTKDKANFEITLKTHWIIRRTAHLKTADNQTITYECQFRFMIPTTRPVGREGFISSGAICSWFMTLGASSAVFGAKWTSSSSSSSGYQNSYEIYVHKNVFLNNESKRGQSWWTDMQERRESSQSFILICIKVTKHKLKYE